MNFIDDPETQIRTNVDTINEAFEVASIRIRIRVTELAAIAAGTEADKDAFIAWLTPAPAAE